jgi:hypothetical protein
LGSVPAVLDYLDYVKYCTSCMIGGGLAVSSFVLQKVLDDAIDAAAARRRSTDKEMARWARASIIGHAGAKRRHDLAIIYAKCRRGQAEGQFRLLERDAASDKRAMLCWAVGLALASAVCIAAPLLDPSALGYVGHVIPLIALVCSLVLSVMVSCYWACRIRRLFRRKPAGEKKLFRQLFDYYSGKRTLIF